MEVGRLSRHHQLCQVAEVAPAPKEHGAVEEIMMMMMVMVVVW
jgi:hypothetical protein